MKCERRILITCLLLIIYVAGGRVLTAGYENGNSLIQSVDKFTVSLSSKLFGDEPEKKPFLPQYQYQFPDVKTAIAASWPVLILFFASSIVCLGSMLIIEKIAIIIWLVIKWVWLVIILPILSFSWQLIRSLFA